MTPHVEIRAVECAEDHVRWSPPEATTATQVVLVTRGRFHLAADGRRLVADATSGYLHPAGHETRFSHPAGGDSCTSITLVGDALTEGLDRGASAVRVDARLELAHRMLRRDQPDPDFAAVESALDLLQLALRREPDDLPAPGRHELALHAREAILADEATTLVDLARLLESSPSHLSRTFRHHVGMPVSRYRNRVRVSRALHRLAGGEDDLASLAVSLGFSDQAHLTRVMSSEVGCPPGRALALLVAGGSAALSPGGPPRRGRRRDHGRRGRPG